MPSTPTSQGTICQYGISGSTFANAVIVSKDITRTDRNITETKNETGQVVGIRMDDYQDTGSVTLQIKSGYTMPTVGGLLTMDGVDANTKFLITSVAKAEEQAGNVRVTLQVRNDENISYA